MKLTRVFLRGMAVSLTLAAAIGIYAFVFGQFGYIETRLIATTLSVGLFSITALGAAIVYERARWRPLMILAFAVSGAGLLLYLYVIWLHEQLAPRQFYFYELLVKAMLITATWAVALPHMGLIGLAPRSAPMLRWLRLLSIVFVCTLAALISAFILIETRHYNEEIWLRAIGVFAILAALGTLVTPIFVRIQHLDRTASSESTALSLKLTCPRCLTTQTLNSGTSRCRNCRLKFRIEIEEPRCPSCGYLLHMLTEPRCPECGQALGSDELGSHAPSQTPTDTAPDLDASKIGEPPATPTASSSESRA